MHAVLWYSQKPWGAHIKAMGNEKSNKYWEAELHPKYDRVGIENFIRAKYVDKRWVPRDGRVRTPSIVTEEVLSAYKPGPGMSNGIEHSSGIKQSTAEVRKLPQPPTNAVTNSPLSKGYGSTPPQLSPQVTSDPGTVEVHQKVEPTVSKKEAKTTVLMRESENKVSKTESEDAASGSRAKTGKVEAPGIPVSSAAKVDYATDLFSLIYMDTGDLKPNTFSATDSCVGIQSSERNSTSEKSACPESVETKTKADVEIEDLFAGLQWVTPQPADKRPEADMHGGANTLEKCSTVSAFPVQQQHPVMSQHQHFLVAAAAPKPFGAPQTLYGNVNQHGFNHLHLRPRSWGTNGNYSPGMTMMMPPMPEMQKRSQMGNTRPSFHAGNALPYPASSIPSRGPSSIYQAPSSIPTHLGGEYDFSSLMQGMFIKR